MTNERRLEIPVEEGRVNRGSKREVERREESSDEQRTVTKRLRR